MERELPVRFCSFFFKLNPLPDNVRVYELMYELTSYFNISFYIF